MIKNIVFDLGKVLIDFNPMEYLRRFGFCDKVNQILSEIIFSSTDWEDCDRGKQEKNSDLVEILCDKNPRVCRENKICFEA